VQRERRKMAHKDGKRRKNRERKGRKAQKVRKRKEILPSFSTWPLLP